MLVADCRKELFPTFAFLHQSDIFFKSLLAAIANGTSYCYMINAKK